MKNKEVIVIIGIILTIIAAELFLLFNLYSQHFEIKANTTNSPYILLDNGKYFEMDCSRDVIDNGENYSYRPFSENLEKDIDGEILRYEQKCINLNGYNKQVTIRKRREDLSISQAIRTNGEEVGEESYYYTRLDYPITPFMEKNEENIKIQDSNCKITIQKEDDQKYELTENSIKIGKEYKENLSINIDMDIECT